MTGKKYDKEKVQWGLIPWEEMEEVARVMEFGARKYGHNNWKELESGEQRYWDAAMRHLIACHGQKDAIDPESGRMALAHAAASILMCMFHAKKNKGIDHG